MARHAAMMELGEKAEGAVLRHGARELSGMILSTSGEPGDDADEREDAVLASAVSTEALDKFNRYRRGHEKAFYTALNKLREIQHDRMTRQLRERLSRRVIRQIYSRRKRHARNILQNALVDRTGDVRAATVLREVGFDVRSGGSAMVVIGRLASGTGRSWSGHNWR
eukprot:Plantae.Rhodophyta-Hildenbrandia_rubra.ctg1699.p2 GENE.Plantae.Rhodophyta-Hildenbrandia_rubra.ctg1699~~Plantae.Rhodophyta-Hildenbrandia_rubra.ctg1699.p2  ORF type:complete len:167 (+),score=11.44 Plantae.Rhodophyta-Hildenbrandia_rubra.ctg1699:887-1387(+)